MPPSAELVRNICTTCRDGHISPETAVDSIFALFARSYRQVAAAPELLEALKANTRNLWELERAIRDQGDDEFADIIRVNADANERLIAKATA